MKLSSREIEYLANIEKYRKTRRIASWIGAALGLSLFIANASFGWFGESLSMLLAMFLGLAVSNLAHECSGIRVEDHLIDLLRRYVNSDSEAIRQIADTVGASANTA